MARVLVDGREYTTVFKSWGTTRVVCEIADETKLEGADTDGIELDMTTDEKVDEYPIVVAGTEGEGAHEVGPGPGEDDAGAGCHTDDDSCQELDAAGLDAGTEAWTTELDEAGGASLLIASEDEGRVLAGKLLNAVVSAHETSID